MGEIDFITVLKELARMYNAEVGPFVLSVYERTLSPYGLERVVKAAEKIVLERNGSDRFPTVADFLDALGETPVSDKNKAIDVANRIWGAIVALGYTAKLETVAERIGEIGMYIAKMHGGWPRLCEETDHLKDSTFFRNQLAREAEAYIEKSQKGCLELPPGFSDAAKQLPANKEVLAAIDIAMGKPGNDQTSIQKIGDQTNPRT